MVKPFKVAVVSTVTHEFEIDANTPEEAESIAEQYVAEGEEGDHVQQEIEFSEAFPAEEEAA